MLYALPPKLVVVKAGDGLKTVLAVLNDKYPNARIAEAVTLRLMDSMYGNRPRLMLTALKAWRAQHNVAITSFALELLTMDFYSSAPRSFSLAPALVDFWAWARKRTPVRLKPPGASTAVVIDDAWHGKAKAAYWRATMAEYHLTQDKII